MSNIQIDVSAEEVVQLMNVRFPRELEICQLVIANNKLAGMVQEASVAEAVKANATDTSDNPA